MSGKNKVEVKIQGRQYTIVASEPDEYIYKIASYVDKKINEVSDMNSRLSMDMAAVLSAINIADEYYKSQKTEDSLRRQLLDYVEEARRSDEKIKMLEFEVSEIKAKLKGKETELAEFIKNF